MKRFTITVFFLFMMTAFAATIVAAENLGAPDIVLDGGSRGKVPFPHGQHQIQLKKDCAVCHSVFPQKTGSIKELKAKGTLKGRDVMNKQCIECHKTRLKEGGPSGPTTCSKCHTPS